ncbi:MAG: PBP1A family penicillin-binding protein [Armatimonadetes bacterium]|nr:PBP1A family penicillin-binding protein [Armatimonadota bacterium]
MRRRTTFRDVIWWALRLTNLALLFLIAGGVGLLLGTYSGIAEIIPKARDLGNIRPGQASRVMSADGELLGQVATELRDFVQLEDVPEALPQAFISVEDQDFYKHAGVDPRGIIRGVIYGRGTSTITQQLVRNVFLTQARTLSRKLAEVVLSVQLERAYTKPEIMELYLNQIYFGEGAYGVQVAAQTYFGKDVSELTVAECALLAGLPRRPEYYSPFEDEQRAKDRRSLVLAKMAEHGFLSPSEAEKARQEPLKLVEERKSLGLNTYKAPYFTNYVLRQVAEKYGVQALYRGGLTIHTTLNLEMQEAAEEAIKWGYEESERRRFEVEQLALVALDVHTGGIKAMVGGVDYGESQYNRAVQGGRQAGSAFKPFVYTAALEAGYLPDSIVEDTPVTYPGIPEEWSPRNYDGKFHGPVTFRKALAASYNVAAVKVADKVGIGAVIETAERMGIWSPLDPYLPLAIGVSDVSPLEMASAYGVFATRGLETEPFGIRRIQDASGHTIFEHKAVTWRALDQSVAEEMHEMLKGVIQSGTGAGIRWMLKFEAAGKTGTSNDYVDAWFVGYSNDLSAAVWAGNDKAVSTKGRNSRGVHGATIPAPVWARFMQKAQPIMAAAQETEDPMRVVHIKATDLGSEEAPAPPAEPPEEVTAEAPAEEGQPVTRRICPSSGLLAGPYCPKAVQVTYESNPPEETCDVHTAPLEVEPDEPPALERPNQPAPSTERVTLPICAISEKIATARCPLVVNRTFDVDKAPTETCDRHVGSRPGL